jgi:hypothetical protein
MKSLLVMVAAIALAVGLLGGSGAVAGPAAGDAPRGGANRMTGCYQPGVVSSAKVQADSLEVANECAAGSSRVVRAIWWGGYLKWQPGEPQVTCFDVRFYDDMACHPANLIASYLDATAETTRVGLDPDGRPCFRYALDVDVTVGPGKFWMSIQTGCPRRDPPKWGRLGDEILDGCPSVIKPAGGTWGPPLSLPDWDASQAFEMGDPSPTQGMTWGRLRMIYR